MRLDELKKKFTVDGKLDDALTVKKQIDTIISKYGLNEENLVSNEEAPKEPDEQATQKPLDNAGNLRIIKVLWGAENSWVDVTAKVKDMLARGQSHIDASGGVFGDPAFGHPKTLKVTYEFHGKQTTESVGEGASFKIQSIPQTGTTTGGRGLRVIKATYGVGSQVADITMQLQSMIINNSVRAGRGWDICHCDPAGGQMKKTIVTYVYGGRKMAKEFGEYESVSLP